MPTLFWGSSPVQPGEAVLLYGSNLQESLNVQLVRLSDEEIGQPTTETNIEFPSDTLKLQPLQPSEQSVKFVIPEELEQGVFAVRVETQQGPSEPFLLNAPNVWWMQGDIGMAASPGGFLYIFGTCLSIEDSETNVVLKGPREEELKVSSDGYSARADLPEHIPAGDYQVFIHNGYGGKASFRGPFTLKVEQSRTMLKMENWPKKVYNVKEFGALGDGKTDDTEAVKDALKKVKQNGVVYFPRGRYLLTETLEIPRFTVLRGEGQELVNVLWPDMKEPLPVMISATNSLGIEDLTFYCTSYDDFLVTEIGTPSAGNVHLRRIRIIANRYRGHPPQDRDVPEGHKANQIFARYGVHGGKLLQLSGNNVEVTDCDFYCSGATLYLTRARGARITGNRFSMGRYGWYWISGCDSVIFEKNIVRGADLTTWGGGINCLDGSSYCQNVYFANNSFEDFWGGDREAMTTDASGGAYFGKIELVNDKEITLTDEPQWTGRDWTGAGIYILDGKGMGQYRQITGYEGREVQLASAFSVLPDSSSTVTIVPLLRHFLILKNVFSDVQVVQLYGSSVEHIIAGNKSYRTMGFHNHGMRYGNGKQPSWYVQYLDNEIIEGNWYGSGHSTFDRQGALSGQATIGVWAFPPNKDFPVPLTLGVAIRRNHLYNNAKIEVGNGKLAGSPKWVQDVLVEDNFIENTDVGIEIKPTAGRVLQRKNRFRNVEKKIETATETSQ